MKWLQVSVVLDGELAEPVSDLLHRYCKGGVILEAVQQSNLVQLRGYLAIDPDTDQNQRKIDEGFWYLSRIQPVPEPSYETVEDQDWAEAWKAHYRPILVGERLLVLPAWISNPEPERIPLILDPGMAFGTGTHPTTRLSLEAIESYLPPGAKMLDLGTGSGILAIAAAKLGAASVLGLDTDPIAIESAAENIIHNQVETVVSIRQGSLDACPSEPKFDLIVVNILAKVLLEMLENGLAELVPARGVLILSGILDHQTASVVSGYQNHGLAWIDEFVMDDWRALVFSRK